MLQLVLPTYKLQLVLPTMTTSAMVRLEATTCAVVGMDATTSATDYDN